MKPPIVFTSSIGIPHAALRVWLAERAAETVSHRMQSAILQLALGLPAVFFTFWLLLAWISLHLPARPALLLSLAAILALFLTDAAIGPVQQDLDFRPSGQSRRVVSVPKLRQEDDEGAAPHWLLGGVARGLMQNPVSPEAVRSGAKALASVVLFGPSMVSSAVRMIASAQRLRTLDVMACVPALALLAASDCGLAVADLAALPGVTSGAVLVLQEIEGVVFSAGPAPTLSLTASRRSELRSLMAPDGG